ncbi:MAG TPA: hypothetical protein V6C52_11725 [Coleofasciculaceae cyanobacterium]|jgi:hypothetical protein
MALDGIGNFNMASARLPQQPSWMARVNQLDRAADSGVTTGLGIGATSAASRSLDNSAQPSFLSGVTQSSLDWGRNRFLADVGNKVGDYLQESNRNLKPGEVAIQSAVMASSGAKNLSYADILRLQHHTMSEPFTWAGFKSQLGKNFNGLTAAIRSGEIKKGFFSNEGITLKKYLRETVVGNNIDPLRNFKDNIGSAGLRSFCYAFMANDIFKATRTAYRNAKSAEDGTFVGQLKTYTEATEAFLAQTVKSGAAWEAGGIGMALGQAIPLCSLTLFGIAVPVVGILVGALLGGIVHQALEHISPTPKEKPASPHPGGPNPFRSATSTQKRLKYMLPP